MTEEKKQTTEGQTEDSIFEKVLKGRVRQVVNELKMPKEAINYIFKQVDETKHAAVKIIATEVRELLQQIDLAEEATKVLTSLSFEITTNIRFIPNEDGKKKRVNFKISSQPPSSAPPADSTDEADTTPQEATDTTVEE